MSGKKKPNPSSAHEGSREQPPNPAQSKNVADLSGSASSMAEKNTLEGIQKEVAAGTYYRDEKKVADKLIRNFLARS